MLHFLTLGLLLGLSAGFTPGPLLTLTVSETLKYDIKAGLKVAVSPFFTDLPIIFFAFLLLSKISDSHNILALISFCGASFIMKFGIDNLKSSGVVIDVEASPPHSLSKGIVTNLLSPHPYLFWLSVGMPIMVKAMRQSTLAVAVFLVSFYVCLVGSKVFLAIVVGKSKTFLSGRLYVLSIRFLGGVLCALAVVLFYDGVKLLFSS